MKRILLVGLFLILQSFSYAAGLSDLDLSKERDYLRVEKGGVIYMIHPSLSDDAGEMEEFSGNNAVAGWAYGNILIMLEKFKDEHPNESPGTIINLINKVKSKSN